MTAWREFWSRVLSPATARFVLALLALSAASAAAFTLMLRGIEPEAEDAVIFAVGQLFALAAGSFGYYFGSTARGDERAQKVEIDQPPSDPVPVEEKR